MNSFCSLGRVCFLVGSLALVIGCGDGGGNLSVQGVATLDGQPLGDAVIEFAPVDAGSKIGGAITRSDAQGKFNIVSDARVHLTPGKYGVRVSKWVDKKTKQSVPPDDVEQLKLAKLAINILPARYSSTESNSPIMIDLKAGANVGVKVEVNSK